MPELKWVCSACGYENHLAPPATDKVCMNCGWRDPKDLPDDDGGTPGYY